MGKIVDIQKKLAAEIELFRLDNGQVLVLQAVDRYHNKPKIIVICSKEEREVAEENILAMIRNAQDQIDMICKTRGKKSRQIKYVMKTVCADDGTIIISMTEAHQSMRISREALLDLLFDRMQVTRDWVKNKELLKYDPDARALLLSYIPTPGGLHTMPPAVAEVYGLREARDAVVDGCDEQYQLCYDTGYSYRVTYFNQGMRHQVSAGHVLIVAMDNPKDAAIEYAVPRKVRMDKDDRLCFRLDSKYNVPLKTGIVRRLKSSTNYMSMERATKERGADGDKFLSGSANPAEDLWVPVRKIIGSIPEGLDREQPSWHDVPEREDF